MATEYHKFDDKAVTSALAAAAEHNDTFGVSAAGGPANLQAGGEFFISAQCISIKVVNHRVCLSLPLGIGNVCLPIPNFVPSGTAVQACLGICTTFGFPTGVRITVTALGHVVVKKTFGRC
jgi:hypothetical protein